jgi:hypothetical protein
MSLLVERQTEFMRPIIERQATFMACERQAAALLGVAPDPRGRLRLPPPPLLTWFIRPGDEHLVDVAGWEAQETARRAARKPAPRTPRPRRPVDVEALKARRARLIAKQNAIGSWRSDDPAAIRLKPRVARRVQERSDRDLTRYVELDRQIRRLDFRIMDAEAKQTAQEARRGG